jgi:hypothetical protein
MTVLKHQPRQQSWFDPYLLLLFGLSLLALTPLWSPGYFFEAHDGRHSVFYQIMFDASLRDGAWWPRWAMHHNQGYGYPTFIIQAPLGFYLAELFVLAGAGFTLAAKCAWSVGVLASGWGMYALVKYWLVALPEPENQPRSGLDYRRLAGVAAGLLYVFIPYHLVDIYVRAALNDSLLLAWFPWVLFGFDRLIIRGVSPGWPRRLGLAALLLAGALLTHTFALISFAPLLVTFVLFRLVVEGVTRGWQALMPRTALAVASGLGALLLCAAFYIPLFVEGQYLQQQVYVANTYDFRRHFVYWGQFFSPFWGFGYSDDPFGANDGMGFQVGLMALIFGAAGLYLLTRRGRRWLLAYLLGMTALILFVMTPAARPLWEILPLLAVIQFPWRLLALSALTLSAAGGLILGELAAENSDNGGVLLFLIILVVFASVPYVNAPLQPVEPWREDGRAIFEFEREHIDMLGYTAWVSEPFTASPMSDAYASPDYSESHGVNTTLPRLAIITGGGEIVSNYSHGSSFGGVVRMADAGVVRIHVYDFPGWQATVDSAPVAHRLSGPQGLVEVDVPAGEHRIDLVMGSTPPRRTGALISWATLVVILGLMAWSEARQKPISPPRPA